MPTAASPWSLAPRLVTASVMAVVPALAIQWARFGSPAQAPALDTIAIWAVCAALASVVAWRLSPRN